MLKPEYCIMRLGRPKVNAKVRTGVSVLLVLVFVGMWAWKTYTGQPINPVTYAVVLAFAIAAGYGIWGEMFGTALEEAQSLQDSGGSGSEGDGGDSDG